MLNRQMFGMKKLTTHHLAPWNKPPKVPILTKLKTPTLEMLFTMN